jgi:hypothetical protein
VMTLQRPPRLAATTANRTGALSRDTLVPERSVPDSTPLATTAPRAVARKLVIFAVIDNLDDATLLSDGRDCAIAPGAAAIVNASTVKPATTSFRIGSLPRT